MLASRLASALATYFVVDPSTVETNLVHDAKIILRDVTLKPQVLLGGLEESAATALVLVGSVKEIEFSWKWGGAADGSTSFVRETLLTIRGARFRVLTKQAYEEHAKLNCAMAPELTKSFGMSSGDDMMEDSDPKRGEKLGYMEGHILQVMDHLTLNLTDIEVSVETARSAEKLLLQAQSLQLLSMGRGDSFAEAPDSSPLSQRLTLGSLSACLVGADGHIHDFWEPVGYAALASRVSGRRFLNFKRGLVVKGESILGDKDRWSIHLQESQLKILQTLVDGMVNQFQKEDAVCVSHARMVEKPHPVALGESTQFVLPFPVIELCLPSNAKIQFPGCAVRYRMDGSQFKLYSAQGITINQSVPLLTFFPDVTWSIDLIRSDFTVRKVSSGHDKDDFYDATETAETTENKDDSQAPIANFVWEEMEFTLLLKALVVVQNIVQATTNRGAELYSNTTYFQKPIIPWSVTLDGLTSLIVRDRQGNWIEGSLSSLSFQFPDSRFTKLNFGRMTLGPSSMGEIDICVPAISFRSDAQDLGCSGAIFVRIASMDLLNKLVAFAWTVGGSDVPSTTVGSIGRAEVYCPAVKLSVPDIEFFVVGPKPLFISMKKVCMKKDCSIFIGSSRCHGGEQQMSIQAKGISMMFDQIQSRVGLKIRHLEELRAASIGGLRKSIENLEVCFVDSTIDVYAPSLSVEFDCQPFSLPTEDLEIESTQNGSGSNDADFSYLYKIRFRSDCVHICVPSKQKRRLFQLSGTAMELSASPEKDGKLRLESTKSLWCRLEASEGQLGWMELSINPTVIVLTSDLVLDELSCGGISIGPSLFEDVFCHVPPAKMLSGSNRLIANDSLRANLVSYEVAQAQKQFLMPLIEAFSCTTTERNVSKNRTSTASLMIDIPELRVDCKVGDQQVQVLATDILLNGTTVRCSRAAANTSDGSTAEMSNIKCVNSSAITMEVGSIDKFSAVGLCVLRSPVKDVNLAFSDSGLSFSAQSVACVLSEQDNAVESDVELVIPFPLNFLLRQVIVSNAATISDTTTIADVQARLAPHGEKEVSFVFSSEKVKNKFYEIEKIHMTGVVESSMQTVNNLVIRPGPASITAGFSSIEWASVLESKHSKCRPTRFPNAKISSFSSRVCYRGKILSSGTNIRLPEFICGPEATADELAKHLIKAIVREMPSFFGNVEILGENLTESTAKNIGRMALSTSLTGSATGSIAGLVVVDSVKGAISSGKKARNGTEHDRYKFGDFTRGSIRSISHAAKSGAESRRGSSDSYKLGDFTTGATQSVKNYAEGNKSRLSAAGGSGIGMAVGTVIAGPLGFFAGSYLGGLAGGRAFQSNEDGGAENTATPELAQASGGQELAMNTPQCEITTGGQRYCELQKEERGFCKGATGDKYGGVESYHKVREEYDTAPSYGPTPETPLCELQCTHEQPLSLNSSIQVQSALDSIGSEPVQSGERKVCLTHGETTVQFEDFFGASWNTEHQRGTSMPGGNIKTSVVDVGNSQAFSIEQRNVHDSQVISDPLLSRGHLPASPSQQTVPPAFMVAEQQPSLSADPNSIFLDLQKSEHLYLTVSEESISQLPISTPPAQSLLHEVFITHDHRADVNLSSSSTNTAGQPEAESNFCIHEGATATKSRTPSVPTHGQSYPTHAASRPSNQQEPIQEKKGYKFGNISRSIMANGKKKAGRSEKDGYKFGDFSRGLFGK
jgi:hypothetical protein